MVSKVGWAVTCVKSQEEYAEFRRSNGINRGELGLTLRSNGDRVLTVRTTRELVPAPSQIKSIIPHQALYQSAARSRRTFPQVLVR